jgi:RimJ/RimL family protein N-acetyltransferase
MTTPKLDLPGNGTKRLLIRLLERGDLEEVRLLHNDDGTLAQLTDMAHVSEPQQEGWFQSVSTSRTSRRYVARLRSNGALVGVFRIDRIDPMNRNAFVGADVAPALRGQGYAQEMFGYFFHYLFDQCGLHRLALVTLETNAPAIAVYRKLGFLEEGRERQSLYRNGRFLDLIAMGLLADEWRQNSATQ